jgi:hypothetical protein
MFKATSSNASPPFPKILGSGWYFSTRDIQEQKDNKRDKLILYLYLRCMTYEEIESKLSVSSKTNSRA